MAAMLGKWILWLVAAAVAVAFTAGGAYYLAHGSASPEPVVQDGNEPSPADELRVEVVRPLKGAMPRTSTGPGLVQSFESADLVAGVSGYLKTQSVDIGDRVIKGQPIAALDVPDLDKQVQHQKAALEAAQAHVAQMKAHVVSAEADVEAAKAEIVRADAAIDSTQAKAVFRGKQYDRMYDLYHAKEGAAIDEGLVDEHRDDRDAAVAAVGEARADRAKADAMVAAAKPRFCRPKPTSWTPKPTSRSPRPSWRRPRLWSNSPPSLLPIQASSLIKAFPGDYVKAATSSGGSPPLLTVEKTDRCA